MTSDPDTSTTTAIWTTEKLNDRAYSEIKNKIISRELAPGTRLVDSQLAEQYGISRTPVRDAIRKLVEEGLVVSNSKKGFFVFKPTPQDIVEIYELRQVLDKAVTTKIIVEMLPANYAFYIREVEAIREAVADGYDEGSSRFIVDDEAFHNRLVRLSNNSRIITIYNENNMQMKGFRFRTSINQERIDVSVGHHRDLVTAIRNMDLDAAMRAITTHIEMSRKAALEDFVQTGE